MIYKIPLHLGEVLEVLETKGINVELLKHTEKAIAGRSTPSHLDRWCWGWVPHWHLLKLLLNWTCPQLQSFNSLLKSGRQYRSLSACTIRLKNNFTNGFSTHRLNTSTAHTDYTLFFWKPWNTFTFTILIAILLDFWIFQYSIPSESDKPVLQTDQQDEGDDGINRGLCYKVKWEGHGLEMCLRS